jgi:hypothetical protein
MDNQNGANFHPGGLETILRAPVLARSRAWRINLLVRAAGHRHRSTAHAILAELLESRFLQRD